MDQCLIDSIVVLLDNFITFFTVCFLYGVLDLLNCFFPRKYSRYGEETCLHDSVYPCTHARFLGDIVGVDDVEFYPFLYHGFLYGLRKHIPRLILSVRGVEEECGSLCRVSENIVFLEEDTLMTADKIGC